MLTDEISSDKNRKLLILLFFEWFSVKLLLNLKFRFDLCASNRDFLICDPNDSTYLSKSLIGSYTKSDSC